MVCTDKLEDAIETLSLWENSMPEINIHRAKREIGFAYIRYLFHWSCLIPIILAIVTIFLLAENLSTALIDSRHEVVVPLMLWMAIAVLLVKSMSYLKKELRLNKVNIETIREYNVEHKLMSNQPHSYFRQLSIISYLLASSVPIVMIVSHPDGVLSTAANDATSVVLHWFAFHTLMFFAVYMGQFHEANVRSK